MTADAKNDLLPHSQRGSVCCANEEATDAQLLKKYLDRREESAFTTLVQRHGPMVFGVCRRFLDAHQAEDAFQATFLVLVRRAEKIEQPELLGNWLYGVACRIAARMWSRRGVQHEMLETHWTTTGDVTDEISRIELSHALDEEILQLPKRYRLPLVLCCLEGKSYEEAARLLACSMGTMKSRLSRARERLQERLRRRGWRVAALTALLTPLATQAQVSPALVHETATMASASIAPKDSLIEQLASEELKTRSRGHWPIVITCIVSALVIVMAVFLALFLVPTGIPEKQPADAQSIQEKPGGRKKKKLVDCWPKVLRFDQPIASVMIDRRGVNVAVLDSTGQVHVYPTLSPKRVGLVAFAGLQPCEFALFPHGKSIAVIDRRESVVRIISVATGKTNEKLGFASGKVPNLRGPLTISPDERLLACRSVDDRVVVWNMRTDDRRILDVTPSVYCPLVFSPDGKLIAVAAKSGIRLCSVATGKVTRRWQTGNAAIRDFTFSENGQLLAYCTRDGMVGVCNLDKPALQANTITDYFKTGTQLYSVRLVQRKNWLLVAGEKRIDVWDLNRGALVGSMKDYHARSCGLAGCAKGDIVGCATDAHTIKIWSPIPAKITPRK